ncbi:DUF4393 domain-containing protein [Clostridium minihomine]|uniref:DUF4393 domain-containing protein n=1 Tax=Clostridium minihomine TaxID=2045012 RepID=UPI000C765C71|nr:DUF4393 domain-containing protein [Clostridium minihomine]
MGEDFNLGDLVLPTFFKNATEEPAKEIGRTISDLISIIFTPVAKAKIRQQAELKQYMIDIEKKASQIPESDICEPKLHIIGPALEASKYYYEDKVLREMFANIIISAMDIKKQSINHPSFVDVLKQISPLDAHVISLFRKRATIHAPTLSVTIIKDRKPEPTHEPQPSGEVIGYHYPETIYPITDVYLMNEDQGMLVLSNYFIETNAADASVVSTSITNLQRLGLISIDENIRLDENQYNKFLNHPYYIDIQESYVKKADNNKIGFGSIRGNTVLLNSYGHLELKKKSVRLTQYGYDFTKVCVLEKEVELYQNR